MIKREAQFTATFRHWLMANPMHSCAFELKQTTKNYLPFSEVKEHQVDALLAVKWGKKGLLWKLSDQSQEQKPFDMFYFRGAYAFVVIRYPAKFCIIGIESFVDERDRSARKSLTMERAEEIAWKTVELKKR